MVSISIDKKVISSTGDDNKVPLGPEVWLTAFNAPRGYTTMKQAVSAT